MEQEIRKQIEQFHMLEKGDSVLIGLSGGADSVCLAQVLYEFRQEYDLKLAAVCCHHGLRGEEADRDVLFVEDFCKERNITFYKAYEDVKERAEKKKLSMEEAGREYRYETFRRIMEKNQYCKLAIAHNADDRAETMLFHLARGTGLSGLCTMEPVREFFAGHWLIRPLLWTKKADIEVWLKEKGIGWRLDGSNDENIYTRNRIRHFVLPELKKVNDRAVEHMGETAQQLSEVSSYLKEEEQRLYDRTVREEKGEKILSASLLKEQHSYMKKAILYRCLYEMAEGRKDISLAHVRILLDLLEGETGREAHFIKGIRARKEYDKLILFRGLKKTERKAETEKEEPLGQMELWMKKYPYTGQEISKNEYTKQFDCDKILNELCLRTWQEGDFLYLKEDGGKKKLGRYFIDQKIPVEKRGQIPLLADGNHILWIVGHRISAYYKVTEKTKDVLEVTIKNKG